MLDKLVDIATNQIIDINCNQNLYIFDCDNSDFNIKLDFNLTNQSNLNLFLLSLNNSNTKRFVINFNHKCSYSTCNCDIKAICNAGKSEFIVYSNVDTNLLDVVTKQNIDGVILSESASIVAIPSLNVSSHEAKAHHSVSIGQIDPEVVFYLMSKGLNHYDTIKTVLKSFFQCFIDNCDQLNLSKEMIEEKIKNMLKGV